MQLLRPQIEVIGLEQATRIGTWIEEITNAKAKSGLFYIPNDNRIPNQLGQCILKISNQQCKLLSQLKSHEDYALQKLFTKPNKSHRIHIGKMPQQVHKITLCFDYLLFILGIELMIRAIVRLANVLVSNIFILFFPNQSKPMGLQRKLLE